ncbi:hypothetical protein SCHPADRAFT_907381 [Schizopora paradoxa]|uniref:Uncharacterized protein n=1 Tax=Schizopora paradoxa TaxID=27342 RepID=A0A0H2RK84_9AGAM|nr:hypothetical protein SCHPADRAFT_907381 [Schizopora paradoxa]
MVETANIPAVNGFIGIVACSFDNEPVEAYRPDNEVATCTEIVQYGITSSLVINPGFTADQNDGTTTSLEVSPLFSYIEVPVSTDTPLDDSGPLTMPSVGAQSTITTLVPISTIPSKTIGTRSTMTSVSGARALIAVGDTGGGASAVVAIVVALLAWV